MSDTVESRPVTEPFLLKPGNATIFGKNPVTPEMEELTHIAVKERLESTEFQSSRLNDPLPDAEAFVEAIKWAMSKPDWIKSIEDRAAGAKNAYEYFLGPQQYWRFKYKGNVYSLCSATNTPVDLELVLKKIEAGEMPSEPVLDTDELKRYSRSTEGEPLVPEHRAYWGSL